MIAVLAGASGLTGQALLDELSSRPEISKVLTPGRGSWNPEEMIGDLYFCALGTTIRKAGSRAAFRSVDFDRVLEFARCCERNQGRAFGLVSASGASIHSPFFYSRVKAEAEAAVSNLSIPTVVIARPALLIGDRKGMRPSDSRPAEALAVQAWRALSPGLPAGLRTRSGTRVEDLARALVDAVLHPVAPRTVLGPGRLGPA
jgi:uncharacterized protein YbjT (DUF2867 family)